MTKIGLDDACARPGCGHLAREHSYIAHAKHNPKGCRESKCHCDQFLAVAPAVPAVVPIVFEGKTGGQWLYEAMRPEFGWAQEWERVALPESYERAAHTFIELIARIDKAEQAGRAEASSTFRHSGITRKKES